MKVILYSEEKGWCF